MIPSPQGMKILMFLLFIQIFIRILNCQIIFLFTFVPLNFNKMYYLLLLDFISPWHIILIVLVALLLFGGKKIKDTMRGVGEGIKEFKKGMKDDEPVVKKEETSAPKTDDAGKKELSNN